ncbi:MAG: hypothetical protein U0703_25045 [Anaerolineae bacterium]
MAGISARRRRPEKRDGQRLQADDGEPDAFYRWLEQPVIVERKDTIYETDRRAPVILVGDRSFDATRTPPDAPDMYFPVSRSDTPQRRPQAAPIRWC